MPLVIEARGVSKRFFLSHNPELKVRVLGLLAGRTRRHVEEFWALKSVSLTIDEGESVGLIGRNGSGKSTFLKIIAGIHRPSSGRLLVANGARISSMIELGTGFHPELTGEENVMMNTSIHGLSRGEALEVYEHIVAYSGLRHFMDVPIKNYSSGMHMRLGFAIAANMNPDVLLLDEIFAVGDADFQRQCMATLETLKARGKTLLFVSHSSAAVHAMCQRACLLNHGRLLFDGPVEEGLAEYRRIDLLAPHEALGPEPGQPAPDPGGGERSRLERGETQDRESAWHRLAAGGKWAEEGVWVYEFLTRQGLRPQDFVLEMGCGSLSAASHLLRYMDQGHYWGFERNIELYTAGVQIELPRAGVSAERGHFLSNDTFDLSGSPFQYDLAISSGLFRQLPLNHIARVIAAVVRKLKPGGKFFATWMPNPEPADFAPIVHADGTTTYSDRGPYHYPFEMLASMASIVGARAEPLDDRSHPRGESVMVITRIANGE